MTLRYTVYDTHRRQWLRRIERPTGENHRIVTDWTRDAAEAARFPGARTAAAVVRMLGGYPEFVVKNAKGEIIG